MDLPLQTSFFTETAVYHTTNLQKKQEIAYNPEQKQTIWICKRNTTKLNGYNKNNNALIPNPQGNLYFLSVNLICHIFSNCHHPYLSRSISNLHYTINYGLIISPNWCTYWPMFHMHKSLKSAQNFLQMHSFLIIFLSVLTFIHLIILISITHIC